MNVLIDSKKWNPNWLILPGLVASIIFYWVYISRAQPQVPYMDTMLFFVQIDRILSGEIPWWNIYGSGEHRGFLYPFVTAVEWKLWRVDARISTVLTGFVVAATFYCWLRALLFVRTDVLGESYSEIKTVLAAIAAAFLIVSPAAFELWTLDLGFAQLIKNLLIVLFFYQLAITRSWEKSFGRALLFGLWGGFLILFATYGWSYPFLAAVTFGFLCIVSSQRHTYIRAAVVLVLMFVAQYIYVRLGQGVFSSSQSASQGFTLIQLMKGVLYGAGSSFMGVEAMAKSYVPDFLPMFLGGILLGCVFVALVKALFTPSPVRVFAATLLVFSLTVLAGITLARGASTYQSTGASRYFVDYVWLLLAPGLVLTKLPDTLSFPSQLAWLSQRHLQRVFKVARYLMAALLIIAMIGHLRTWQVELKVAPFRAAIFKSMAEIYRKGVTSEADAALLQSPHPIAKQGVLVAKKYRLTVENQMELHCNLLQAEYSGDWYAPENNTARWMGRHGQITLGSCKAAVKLEGYIPTNFSARNLHIAYGDKKIVIALEPGKQFALQLDQINNDRETVTLNVDGVTSPLAEGMSNDERELGMLLTYIGE